MRPSILPNLLTAARRNADRFEPNAALYEIGPQYRDDTPEGQEEMATGVRVGRSGAKRWERPGKPVEPSWQGRCVGSVRRRGPAAESVQIVTELPAGIIPAAPDLKLGPKGLG